LLCNIFPAFHLIEPLSAEYVVFFATIAAITPITLLNVVHSTTSHACRNLLRMLISNFTLLASSNVTLVDSRTYPTCIYQTLRLLW
ncbi:hypothetical protein, partial [Paenibacillus alginolyticus]|uniref:hypothetical protein n=1 Tax=Paenibacillus alginolyticus TaxID=59839 RepID=UPI001C3F82AE